MKYIATVLFCLLLINTAANGPNDKYPKSLNEISTMIENSFESGNSEMLQSLLSEELELIIDSEKIEFAKISKERAGFILASFFKHNPPIQFDFVYEGNTSETLRYSVASYKSSNTEFLIYMLIKENPDQSFRIKTLQMREN